MKTRRINRRDFLAFSGLAVSGLVLASCAPSSQPTAVEEKPVEEKPTAEEKPTEEKPVVDEKPTEAPVITLDYWSEWSAPPQSEAMAAILDAWNTENPDLPIKHTAFENTPYKAALKAAHAGGEVPDLYCDDTAGWLAPYVNADQLVDLSDMFTPEIKANLDQGAVTAVTYKGKQWAAPMGTGVNNLLYYNTDILAAQGIDPATLTTWSAFTAACEKLKQAGITPIIIGNKEGWIGAHWLGHMYVRTMGTTKAVELFHRALEPGSTSTLKFTDPMSVKAWELLKELQDKGYFSDGIVSDDYAQSFAKFFRGDGAFFYSGSWLVAMQKDQAPDLKMGYFLFPAVDGIPESDATETVGGSLGIRIPKGAKHPEEAKKFILWFLTSETPHILWSKGAGDLPIMKTITTFDGATPEQLDFLRIKAAANGSTIWIDSSLDGDVSQKILWEASNGLFSGALTPQTACENAEQAVQAWQQANP